MNEKQSFVPLSITASSREKLTEAMLMNNFANGRTFKYFDIQQEGKTWVAWYYADLENHVNKVMEQFLGK